jgi:hypothetical protein
MDQSKYSAEQKKWCEDYKHETGFEPIMEEYEANKETFYQAAMRSAQWFEDWSSDAFLRISNKIPAREEDLYQ